MKRTAVTLAKPRRAQTGSYLLEALIAILIFAFGVLGLIGLLGNSIRYSNDARYRTEAANLAGGMIAEMWVTTPAQMDDYGSGVKHDEWHDKAKALLPSAELNVDLTEPALSGQSRTATVTVRWQLPGEGTKHSHVVSAQIGRN
jgi:type IV pilus assembly protein PilV